MLFQGSLTGAAWIAGQARREVREQPPGSRQVLKVKRGGQAAQGIGIFCQRLLLRPAGRSLRDHEGLATLPGLPPGTRDAQLYMQLYLVVLALMGLEYVDAEVRGAGRLLLAAREG